MLYLHIHINYNYIFLYVSKDTGGKNVYQI